MATHDLVIRGGSVIDGSGSAARTADVAIDGETIVEVGKVDGSGTREIDAAGALVTPGFVDVHTHYDGQATWDNHLAPSSWHGVTTVIMGNCGVGFAPVNNEDHNQLIELMEGVEDIPGAALHEGLAWNWNSFAEYLDAVEAVPHDIDCGAYVPHGALRLHVMGQRGANREPATPEDIAAMADLVRHGIEAGGVGFSTSRTANHRTSKGELTPTLNAEADELIGIAEAVGAAGRGVLQVVSDHLDGDHEFAMLRAMAERSGRPLSVSLVATPVRPQWHRMALGHIEAANEAGLQVRGQVAPRPVGLVLGLDLTLNPFMATHVWKGIADLPMAAKVAALRNPETRSAILAEMGGPRGTVLGAKLVSKFEIMFELSDPPNYEPAPSDSLKARAAAAGTTPEEMALDILLADDGQGLLYVPFANYLDGSLDVVEEMLNHPFTIPGLGDGGAHVGTICDGSFSTTLLTHWGRDRSHGRIPVEQLIKQHCQDTAAAVGLTDRGQLLPGLRADINVIDFENLQALRPEIHHDLPAGGRRLLQRATGYLHTICAGQEIYQNGVATGALPGRLIRHAG
ncbi:amidohydrolase family protein [Acidimicrobiales bacterium]|jgi:N-acyl-D-aspartate/D-glutamate deacylase|nr:amidohydrolase family protein [bacterium]MDB9845164.1 amidohydrolase family protein [Acidimicrobiales bacterium]